MLIGPLIKYWLLMLSERKTGDILLIIMDEVK